MNVLKHLVIAQFLCIMNQFADVTILHTATGKKRNVTEFTNIVKELVMNKVVLILGFRYCFLLNVSLFVTLS